MLLAPDDAGADLEQITKEKAACAGHGVLYPDNSFIDELLAATAVVFR